DQEDDRDGRQRRTLFATVTRYVRAAYAWGRSPRVTANTTVVFPGATVRNVIRTPPDAVVASLSSRTTELSNARAIRQLPPATAGLGSVTANDFPAFA